MIAVLNEAKDKVEAARPSFKPTAVAEAKAENKHHKRQPGQRKTVALQDRFSKSTAGRAREQVRGVGALIRGGLKKGFKREGRKEDEAPIDEYFSEGED